ncbi:helix-turn-helix domain-containing protein [Sanguibacter inulinus]|uniref:helix-turn-helix domain-containing protein n=1 Tax=Sanguibacter inulinus TaxID=60922 RepID=UPI002803F738|nr:helix-turn-helix transcriptional regulator [Sanguibacter inulinus]
MGTLIPFPVRPAAELGRTTQGTAEAQRTPVRDAGADHTPLATPRATGPSLLWREAVGHELRGERTAQSRTLADVARRAGVSTQYLSEIERGRKEPSSEVLEAIGSALSLTLLNLTSRVSGALARGTGDGARLMAA